MTPANSPTASLISSSMQAFRRGNWKAALDAVLQAIQQDPQAEEAWLLLAALAPPEKRAPYLRHVLELNPDSPAARAALLELTSGRAPSVESRGDLKIPAIEKLIPRKVSADSFPGGGNPLAEGGKAGASEVRSPAESSNGNKGSAARMRWPVLLVSTSCVLALLAAMFARGISSAQELPVMERLPKAENTIAPTLTPSFTPTVTPSFTPTFTPTLTPTPSYTPSPTARPTNTRVPTIYVPPPPAGVGGGVHWVDVDISSQTLTAYAGDTPIRTFLVSTGVSKYPTVIGRFHIYARYISTLMSGQGYYLPNVPYTQYFYEGYSLHGTYWHHNFGHPMSHGCVNMYTPDAAWMWDFATFGTLVNIHW
jgi:lipoprotein-anchoring transpeptidase ErfK/SrfK